MKKKKAYSMIELIMAIGSLLLVLGVFSVIVKTYLEEFSEGTLGERKWADVQTFFTYVSRDLEGLSESLGSGKSLEINSNGTINIKSSDGTVADSVVYSIDDSTGEISRDGTVIVKVNKNFEIDGLKLKVYENALTENSINSSWEYKVLTSDTVDISSEATSNYYIEPLISLADGSEISGGYALRFDNVTESEETVIYEETYTEKGLKELENNTILIDSSGYYGLTKTVTLTAEALTGNLNKLESVTYYSLKKDTSGTKTATYDFEESVLGNNMEFVFEMADNGLTTKEIKITVTLK